MLIGIQGILWKLGDLDFWARTFDDKDRLRREACFLPDQSGFSNHPEEKQENGSLK